MCHHRVLPSVESMGRSGGTAHTASGAAMVHAGFSGETGWNDQEGNVLCVQELVVCMELLYGMWNRLGEPLWVRVREETCWCDIMVGDKATAIRVRNWTKPHVSNSRKSPDQ